METVFVYRLDFKSKAEIPLGTIVERRGDERKNNRTEMLRLARKEFAKLGIDASGIFISSYRYE